MIAKGLDFPEVTLAAVINADTTLKLPDFRAAERTYDLLEQVAGRAGRGELAGKVIVQSYWASHPAIQAVAAHDRASFVEWELAERHEACYPPFARLANVVASGKVEAHVRAAIDAIAQGVRTRVREEPDWEVLGPAECVRKRINDLVRRHIVIKAPADARMGELIQAAVREAKVARGVSVSIDIDARDMM